MRRWRLIEIGAGPALTVSPLRIDERVLHYLVGVPHLDERLAGMVGLLAPPAPTDLAASHAVVAKAVVAAWSAGKEHRTVPLIQLYGPDPADRRAVAGAAAAALGLRLAVMPGDLVPAAAVELDSLVRI